MVVFWNELQQFVHLRAVGLTALWHGLVIDEAVMPSGCAGDFEFEILKGAVFSVQHGMQSHVSKARFNEATEEDIVHGHATVSFVAASDGEWILSGREND